MIPLFPSRLGAGCPAERTLFVIDVGRVVRWREVLPVDVNPGADGILRMLEALATSQVTRAVAP